MEGPLAPGGRRLPDMGGIPFDVTVLRLCRCVDCTRWDARSARCWDMGYRQAVPQELYLESWRRYWSDVGTHDPTAWHWCAQYAGEWISGQAWVRQNRWGAA